MFARTYVCKPCQYTTRRRIIAFNAKCPECGEKLAYLQESNTKGMVPPKGHKRWALMQIKEIPNWGPIAIMPKEKPNYPPGKQPC